jgi:cellulose synthase/poly-beta-1,6-N-acetylglucosamine synthase-like glycosyltransferase
MTYSIDYFGYILLVLVTFLSVLWLLIFLEYSPNSKGSKRIRSYPSLAIVIPTIWEGKRLRKTVVSALRADYPRSKCTIYIALNKSATGETVRTAQSIDSDRVVVTQCPTNGKASVLNYMLKRVIKEDLLMVLDADSAISRDVIKRIVPYFDNEKVGGVVPALLVSNPNTPIAKLQRYEYLLSILSRKAFVESMDWIIVHGVGSTLRVSVVKKLGYFDDKANPTEDLEMGLKMLTHDYKIENAVSAVSSTEVPSSLGGLFKQRTRWFYGFYYNVMKHRKAIFSKEHRKIGFMTIPIVLSSMVIGTVALAGLLYSAVFIVGKWILYEFALVSNTSLNYAVSSQLTYRQGSWIFSLNTDVIMTVIVTIIGLASMAYALRYSEAKVGAVRDTLGMVVYLALYTPFLLLIWLYASVNYVLGRNPVQWKGAR